MAGLLHELARAPEFEFAFHLNIQYVECGEKRTATVVECESGATGKGPGKSRR
jgi:hypothetical protein